MNNKNSIGITGILFLIFLTLKLTNNIDWSWWWVTSPVWIPLCIIFTTFIVAFFVFFVWGIILLLKGHKPEDVSNKFNNMVKKKPQ
jgi:phosphoglycerol transferase MdoB-like AlkP superfamily enzyme